MAIHSDRREPFMLECTRMSRKALIHGWKTRLIHLPALALMPSRVQVILTLRRDENFFRGAPAACAPCLWYAPLPAVHGHADCIGIGSFV